MPIDVAEIKSTLDDSALDETQRFKALSLWINEHLIQSESHDEDLNEVGQFIHDYIKESLKNKQPRSIVKANTDLLVKALIQQHMLNEQYDELTKWYRDPSNVSLLKHVNLVESLDGDQAIKEEKINKFAETMFKSFFEPQPNPEKLIKWLRDSPYNADLAAAFKTNDKKLEKFVSEQCDRNDVLQIMENGRFLTLDPPAINKEELLAWLMVPANKSGAENANIPQYLQMLGTEESESLVTKYGQVKETIDNIEELKQNTWIKEEKQFLPKLQSSLQQTQAPEIFKVLNGSSRYQMTFNHALCREYLNVIFSEQNRGRIANKTQLKEQQNIAIKQFIEHIENPTIGIKDSDINCLAQYCDYVSTHPEEPLSQDVVDFYVKYLNSDKVTDQQLHSIRDSMLQLFKTRPDLSALNTVMDPLIKKISTQGKMKNDPETDELLSLHLKTLLRPKPVSSEAALLLITEKLKENKPNEPLRTNYSTIIEGNPQHIAEKLILNLQTFSNLSEQIKNGRPEYSRETRAAAAINAIPSDKIQEVAQLLAYELIINTEEKSAAYKENILEMLNQNYAGTIDFKNALQTEVNKLLEKSNNVPLKDSKQSLINPSPELIETAWLAKGTMLLNKPLDELDDNTLINVIDCLEKAGGGLEPSQWKKVLNFIDVVNLTESQADNIWKFLEKSSLESPGSSDVVTAICLDQLIQNTATNAENIDPDILSRTMHLVAMTLPHCLEESKESFLPKMSVIFQQVQNNTQLADKFAESSKGFQEALIVGLNICKESKNFEMAAELYENYPDPNAGFNAWIASEKDSKMSDSDMLFMTQVWLKANKIEYEATEEPIKVMLKATELPRDMEIWDAVIRQGESWDPDKKTALLSSLTTYLKSTLEDINVLLKAEATDLKETIRIVQAASKKGKTKQEKDSEEQLNANQDKQSANRKEQFIKVETTMAMLNEWKILPEQLHTLGLTALFAINNNILIQHSNDIADIPSLTNIDDIQSKLFIDNMSVLQTTEDVIESLRAYPDSFENAAYLWIKDKSTNEDVGFDQLLDVCKKIAPEEREYLLDICKELLPEETYQKLNKKFSASGKKAEYSEDLNKEISKVLKDTKPDALLNKVAELANRFPLQSGHKSDTYWKLLATDINEKLSKGGDEVDTIFSALTSPQDFSRLQEAYDNGKPEVQAAIKGILKTLFIARPVELMNKLSDWDRESERNFLIDALKLKELPTSPDAKPATLVELQASATGRTQESGWMTNLHKDLKDNLNPQERNYIQANIKAYDQEKGFSSKIDGAEKKGKYARMEAYWPNGIGKSFLLATGLWRLYKAPEPPSGTGVSSRYYHVNKEQTDVTNPLHAASVKKPVSLTVLTKTTADVEKKQAEKDSKKVIPDQTTEYSKLVTAVITQLRNNEAFSDSEPWRAPITVRKRGQSIVESEATIEALKKEKINKRLILNEKLTQAGENKLKDLKPLQEALADFVSTSIRLAIADKKGGDLSEVGQYINDIKHLKGYEDKAKTSCIDEALYSCEFSIGFGVIHDVEAALAQLKVQLIQARIDKDPHKKQMAESRVILANLYLQDVYAKILERYPEDKVIKEKNEKLLGSMDRDVEKLEALLDNTLSDITHSTLSSELIQKIGVAHVICQVLEKRYSGTPEQQGIIDAKKKLGDYIQKHSKDVLLDAAKVIASGQAVTSEQVNILQTVYKTLPEGESKESLKVKFNVEIQALDKSLDSILNNKKLALGHHSDLNNTEILRNLIKTAIKLNIAGDSSVEYAEKIKAVSDKINKAVEHLTLEAVGLETKDSHKSDELIHLSQVLEEISLQSTENANKPLIDSLELSTKVSKKLEVLPALETDFSQLFGASKTIEPTTVEAHAVISPPLSKEDAVKNFVGQMLTNSDKKTYKDYAKERHDLSRAFDLNLDPKKTAPLIKHLSDERDKIIKSLYDGILFGGEQGNLATLHQSIKEGKSFTQQITAYSGLARDLKKLSDLSVKLSLLGDSSETAFNSTVLIFQKVSQYIEDLRQKSTSITSGRVYKEEAEMEGIVGQKEKGLQETNALVSKFHAEPLTTDNIRVLCKELESLTAKLVSTNTSTQHLNETRQKSNDNSERLSSVSAK